MARSNWPPWLRLGVKTAQRYRMALLLGLIGTIAVVFLWHQALGEEKQNLEKLVEQQAKTIQVELNHEISSHILALKRMADRWEASGGVSQAIWESDAASHLRDFYAYQAIGWVDSSFRLRRIVSLEDREALQNLDLSRENQQSSWRLARDLHQTMISHNISLHQGDKGFLVNVPLFISHGTNISQSSRFDGFIVGVFKYQKLFDDILKLPEGYKVKISDRTGIIYVQDPLSPFEFTKTVMVNSYGVEWVVEVFATAPLIKQSPFIISTMILWGGMTVILSMVLSIVLGQRAQSYSQQLRKNNQQLQEEIAQRHQVEAKLWEREEHWQLALQGNKDGIWDWNIKTNLITYSVRCKEMLGYAEHEHGNSDQERIDLLHPDDREWVIKSIQDHLAKKTPFYLSEHRVRCKDGTYKWILDRGQALWDEAGNPIRMVGSHTDITQRQKYEESIAQLAAIVEFSEDAIISKSLDGIIHTWNAAAERLFGYNSTEVIGKPITMLFPPDYVYEETEILANICRGEHIEHYQTVRQRKDGTKIQVSVSISPIKNNKGIVIGVSKIVRDISEQYKIEEALRRAMEVAETANSAKSAFLANMSHELRTPLNVILGFTEVMASDSLLPPSHQENLETIRRSGDHLLSLINDILDLAKIEAGHYTIEEQPFDLITLVDNLSTMLSEWLNSKDLWFKVDISPAVPQFIIGDDQRLHQILLNLLSNAIKFTSQGGINLRVTLADVPPPTDYLTLQIEVTDTGIGIATDQLEMIFDAFVQAKAQGKTSSGTGLGLTISRKLLKLMGGEISVKSILGQGSTFIVTIPVHPVSSKFKTCSEQYDRPVIGLAPHQPIPRILVVDDHPDNQLLLVRLLTKLGLEVRQAINGLEAVEIWQQWHPHLIWMDLRMPILDGYEATKQIRAQAQGQDTVIIALTAQASDGDRSLSLAAGCNDYIAKPFYKKTLLAKMKEYLGLEYLYLPSDSLSARPGVPAKMFEKNSLVMLQQVLMSLPQEWLGALENAAVCGDDGNIVALVNQIAQSHPQLANYLTYLANQFQFEAILQLIQQKSTDFSEVSSYD